MLDEFGLIPGILIAFLLLFIGYFWLKRVWGVIIFTLIGLTFFIHYSDLFNSYEYYYLENVQNTVKEMVKKECLNKE